MSRSKLRARGGADVRELMESVKLGKFANKILEATMASSVADLHALQDSDALCDEALAEYGMKKMHIGKFRRALRKHKTDS